MTRYTKRSHPFGKGWKRVDKIFGPPPDDTTPITKRRRRKLLQDRVEIMNQHYRGIPVRALADSWDVSESALWRFIKKEEREVRERDKKRKENNCK